MCCVLVSLEPMAYPATFQINTPDRIANWRPLVQWFLAIPHILLAGLLCLLGGVVSVIAWVVVLSTGKLPQALAGFLALIIRYGVRIQAYVGFLTDTYPNFDMTATAADPGGSVTSVNFSPALEGRNRLTVLFRLILPFTIAMCSVIQINSPISVSLGEWLVAIILGIIAIPALIWFTIIGVIATVCWILAFFAVLFTGQWPAGLRKFVIGAIALEVRYNAYTFFLTDDYPPFSMD